MATQHAEIVAEIETRRLDISISLLRVYNYYRLFTCLALLAFASQPWLKTRLGDLAPEWFFWVSIAYAGINLFTIILLPLIPREFLKRQFMPFAVVIIDTLAISVLMYLSAGVGSGLGALILISVAMGAIFFSGQLSTLIAAVASISVLYEEFYLSLTTDPPINDYFQAGILGVLYFTAAFAIQNLSKRLRRNEIRSLTQAAELQDLERVNRLIIQRMRTGIILVDQNDYVRMVNQSARSLLGLGDFDATFVLPPTLRERLLAWREDTGLRTAPFQLTPNTPEIRVNFSAVRTQDAKADVTIFLEDTGEIQQQAQQLKLAELGQLSASIAHEIRNPLGAISHASQLLKESVNLDKGDARLTDIIHSHCQRMNGVVENVLELSRRRTPHPEKLNLQPWIEEFITEFSQTEADHCEIALKVTPVETEIRMDPSQLTQILNNLVHNGLRYSMEHANVRYVCIEGGIDAGTERPFINVVDRGPGVAADKVSSLFDPFITHSATGTGLGLYLSRELCEANQARISYQRHVDGGSCFRITFAHPDRITA